MPNKCPFCGKEREFKITCGRPECQYLRIIRANREYWDKNRRKTTRHNKHQVQGIVAQAMKRGVL